MKKKLNIICCIAFFLMLLIPLCFADFSGGKISELEKRELAKFPEIFNENGDFQLSEIGKIDDWISDNIGFRDTCVDLYTKLMVNTLGVSSSDKVMAGKDGWYFYTLDNNIDVGLGNYLLDESTLKSIAEKQQLISDYYKANGIEYALVITPSKASVYTEYVLGGDKPVYTVSDQISDYLGKNTDVNIISVKDALIGNKSEGKMFLKTDTHWTEQGSYIAYCDILNSFSEYGVIDAEPVDVDFSNETGFGFGEFGMMLGNYEILGEEEYSKAVFEHHAVQITDGDMYNSLAMLQSQINPNYPAVVLNNEYVNDSRLLIYGDSQWELFRNMPWYFSENFSQVVSMRADNPNEKIDYYANPNAVLFACSERYIDTKLNAPVPNYITSYFANSESIENILSLPTRPLDSSVNGTWIDYCNGKAQPQERLVNIDLENTQSVTFTGWSADMVNMTPLGALFVRVGDEVFPCSYGEEASSVADYFQNENLRYTGFTVNIPTEYFSSDINQLRFIEVGLDGTFRYEDVLYNIEYGSDKQTEGSSVKDMDAVAALSLPTRPLDSPVNGTWIDYCNDVAQPQERYVSIDIKNAESVTLKGWAADMVNMQPLGALFICVGDEMFKCDYGEEAGSVSDYFQNENLRYTGFSVNIPAEHFSSDIKQISFIEVGLDGTFRYEDVIYNAEIIGAPHNSWVWLLMIAVIVIVFLLALLYLKKSNGGEMFQKFNENKFLFSELIKRDFTLRYKRTVLGMMWSMISPLVNLLIMWLVFQNLMGGNINHYVIYLFSGQLVFNFFNEATSMGMTSLLDNAGIFSKVNVPKYLFLFSRNIASLINFGLTLIIYLLFVAIDGIPFSIAFLSLLYPILCLTIMNLGIGMILSALYVFFRDMRYLWGIASQLIMWLSVIFYSIDSMAPNVQKIFLLNPVYLCIKYFRSVVIEGVVPDLSYHLLMAFFSLGFFAAGCLIYKKKNHEFLYYI